MEMTINLPPEMLQKEAFKSLPAKEKEEYLSNVLIKILYLNPEGITISQIREASGLTYSTLWHHLELLSSTAQCQKASKGNLDIYYPIGDLTHLNDFDKGKSKYSVSKVENTHGKFICIHEKKENRAGSLIVSRGVFVPIELLNGIIQTLGEIKKHHLNGTNENNEEDK